MDLINLNNILNSSIELAIQEKQAFVLFAKPQKHELYFLRGAVHELNPTQLANNNGDFIFYPFDEKSNPIYTLISEEQITIDIKSFVPPDVSLADFNLPMSQKTNEINKSAFVDFVDKIKSKISEGSLAKCIASRPIQNPLDDGICPFKVFTLLLENYSNAFRYLICLPGKSMWIGASPELLFRNEENRITSVALAGTKTSDQDWTEKEIIEQKIVGDYLLDTFKQLGLTEITVDPIRTVQAGDIQHLKNEVHGFMLEDQWQELVANMHPTPAVGGFPKKDSIELIKAEEGYERGYYAGFLGPCSTSSKEFYVNLRCAKISGNFLTAYVGAGITKDSDAEKEWIETEKKSKTILSLFEALTIDC